LKEYKKYVKSMLDDFSDVLTSVMFDDFKVRAHSKKEDEFSSFVLYLNTLIASLQRKDSEVRAGTEDLQRSQRVLQKIIDSMPIGILVFEKNGGISKANNAALHLLGYESENQILEMASNDGFGLFREKHALPESDKRTDGVEFVLISNNGDYIPILRSSIPVEIEGKQSLLEAFIDISEIKRAEILREELIRELEDKNAELERFSYTVSHDLKSPLITIKGFLGVLKQDLARGETEHINKNIRRIENAADKMNELMEQLLEFSKMGRKINKPEIIDMNNLVKDVVELLSGNIEKKGARVDIYPDLPPVVGDYPRIFEVIENLIDNAVKFSMDANSPYIKIGYRIKENDCVFFVEDNGVGIDHRYHKKIFGIFEKLDQETEGSGIGLSLVKRVIEVHGGNIRVESQGKGKGARFLFTIPGMKNEHHYKSG